MNIQQILFGYLRLKKQPSLPRLRHAGGTECIVVAGDLKKRFILCKSIRPDSKLDQLR